MSEATAVSYTKEDHEPSATATLVEAFRDDPIFRGIMVKDEVRTAWDLGEGVGGGAGRGGMYIVVRFCFLPLLL